MFRMPEKQTYSRTVLNCSRICFHLYANPCKLPLLSIKLKNPGFLYYFSICFVSFHLIFVQAVFFHVNLGFREKKKLWGNVFTTTAIRVYFASLTLMQITRFIWRISLETKMSPFITQMFAFLYTLFILTIKIL